MMSDFPYAPMQFDRLALMVWTRQKSEVEHAIDRATCLGRWEPHVGGVLEYRGGFDGRKDDRIELWTFYAEDREQAERAQHELDLIQ